MPEDHDIERQLLIAVLDYLSVATIITRASRRVVASNESATRVLHRGDGLECHGQTVRAMHPEADQALGKLIERACGESHVRRGCVGVATIPRNTGRPAYRACVVPLRARRHDVEASAAGLFVIDPDMSSVLSGDVLRAVFSLSPSELRVVHGLMQGMNPAEIAKSHCISTHTARTHLRNIFAKTGTRRQADLLRVISSIVGGLNLDEQTPHAASAPRLDS